MLAASKVGKASFNRLMSMKITLSPRSNQMARWLLDTPRNQRKIPVENEE